MKLSHVLVFHIFFVATCSAGGRIYGGTETVIERQPYMASIVVMAEPPGSCGASIISTKFLLTTSVCNMGQKYDVWARVGSTANNTGGQLYKIDQMFTFSHYQRDALLLGLHPDNEILMGPTFPGVGVIPLSADEPEEGSQVLITGWGPRNPNDTGVNDFYLREVNLTVMNIEFCNSLIEELSEKDEREEDFFCAGGGRFGEGAFGRSDIGGPAVHGGVQIGIMYYYYKNEDTGENPGVILKITPDRRQWIREKTGV